MVRDKIRLGLREQHIPIPKDAPTKLIKVELTEDEKEFIKDSKKWLKEHKEEKNSPIVEGTK